MQRKRGRKRIRPDRKTFEKMYYNETMTVHEIAEFYNVNMQTVYNWAREFKKEKKDV